MKAHVERMKRPIRVLHLEDNSLDAELISSELESNDIRCSITQVYTQEAFETALQKGGIDIILSDSHLPSFDTLAALTRTRELCPSVPFVFVSGTSSPTLKANAFFRGASEFIQKNELSKLVSFLNQLFSERTTTRTASHLPEMGIPVLVRCKDFRCLGFLDRNGKWRDYNTSAELPDVIDWSGL
jgi:CheY-like chemotaxis protein